MPRTFTKRIRWIITMLWLLSNPDNWIDDTWARCLRNSIIARDGVLRIQALAISNGIDNQTNLCMTHSIILRSDECILSSLFVYPLCCVFIFQRCVRYSKARNTKLMSNHEAVESRRTARGNQDDQFKPSSWAILKWFSFSLVNGHAFTYVCTYPFLFNTLECKYMHRIAGSSLRS